MNAVETRAITKSFGSGETRVEALRATDFDARFGELTFVVGPSGSGKTTLLSVVAGLLDHDGGSLHVLDAEPAGFAWLVAEDAAQSVLAWLRLDGAGDAVVVACNFTPVPRRVYRVGVPVAGDWRVALDTDAPAYGGSGAVALSVFATDAIPLHGHAQSLALDLPPLATVFLVPA